MFLIDLNIDVVPKQRVRGAKGVFYTAKETRDCMTLLAYRYREYMIGKIMIPKKIPLKVFFAIWTARPFMKADIDNFYKTISDSGNKILYADDRQIVEIGGGRMIFNASEPRMKFRIEALEPYIGDTGSANSH